MKTVTLTDAQIVTAQLPAGHTYWSEEARRAWLAEHGITEPFTRRSDPVAKTHTFVMPEEES